MAQVARVRGGPLEPYKSRSKFSNLEEKYPAGKMSVYFGSQTGTAMGFARNLANQFRSIGFEVKVVDLGDFDPQQLLVSRVAIFVVASYGDGDPTDNAYYFYQWLRNTKGTVPNDYLSNVSFAVFGLGNSTYTHYNQMGRNCDGKLELLGAQRLFPFGFGDDSRKLEEDFELWKAKIIPFLTQKYLPVKEEVKQFDSISTYPRANLTFNAIEVSPTEKESPSIVDINTSSKYFFSSAIVTVGRVRDLRSRADSGRTLHIELDSSKSDLKYRPADNLAVIPENDPQVVEMFSTTCGGYDLARFVELIPVNEDEDVEFVESETKFRHPFPHPCSIRTIFSSYLDICGIPRRSTIERFAGYVTNPKQLLWLEDLLSKENREKFTQYIELEGRSYASLLQKELSSCVIPLDHLLHLVPLIQPRYYTISSSSSLYPKSIHLTVTLSERKSPSGQTIHGLCSKFLSSLTQGSSCRVFFRESLFRLPESLQTPIIMVGPGAGIAPMIALLQEREYQAQQQNIPLKEVVNILFFGCKSRKLDYLYQEELQAALEKHALTSLKVAFSREKEEKLYVQHLLQQPENTEEIYRMFENGAHIFVCGGTGMGSAVAESFASILATHKGITLDEARSIIKAAQKGKIYKQELWSV